MVGRSRVGDEVGQRMEGSMMGVSGTEQDRGSSTDGGGSCRVKSRTGLAWAYTNTKWKIDQD